MRVLSTGCLTLQGSSVHAVFSALTSLYPVIRPFRKAKRKKTQKRERPKKGADRMWKPSSAKQKRVQDS